MSSIKCKKCSLINFSQAHECKRCGFQFENKQSKSAHFQQYQMPPPPPNFGANEAFPEDGFAQPKPPCIKCGSKQNVSIYDFKKKHIPLIVSITIFLGLIPYLILRLLLGTTHFLTAPFCHQCWSKFKNVTAVSILNVLGFLVIFFGGIVFATVIGSEVMLWTSIFGAILFYIFGRFYISNISPKYKKVNSRQVIIDAPYVGEILYEK